MLEDLTLRENLEYACHLQSPRVLPKQQVSLSSVRTLYVC
jgi:hypothetical protein